MAEIVDDKSQHCLPFMFERLQIHHEQHAGSGDPPPFFLGLNGVQGVGKTMLVSSIKRTLENPPHNLPTAVFSLDDLYLTHSAQLELAHRHLDNPLLQHRGQPSTHDLDLARSVFSSLRQNRPTAIPQYNKAAFNGQGDRVPEQHWESVNVDRERIIKVVLFEGWAVGFRPLAQKDLERKWEQAVTSRETGNYTGRLAYNTLDSVDTINTSLRHYAAITDQLDALVHLDALESQYVYRWRIEQETGLRASKGSGMSEEQVKRFVDAYYPAYELFTDSLRAGIFGDREGSQLRITVGEDRCVRNICRI